MAFTSGINSIDSLLYSSWASSAGRSVSLTYSFMTSVPADASTDDATGFAAMTAVQRAAVKVALDSWAAVANVKFTLVSSGGNIQLATNNQGSQSSAYAYLPDGSSPTYLFLNNADTYNSTFTSGGFSTSVLLHELGHTLGLKHPGDYNSTGGEIDGPFLPAATDNLDYTQMSYNTGSGFELNGNYGVTPMLYDIQAMQYLYGANTTYHTGADSYRFITDSALQCIWDAGGTDTFDFSACTNATVINLNAGTFSSTAPGYNNISIAYNVTIERATAGSGGSTIYGNAAGNLITGGAGSDMVYQGSGNDTIALGAGSDTVVLGKTAAAYTFAATSASLTVVGDGTDVLTGVDTLQFSGLSVNVALDAQHVGTSANNTLTAGAGNELFAAGAGLDTLSVASARANYQVQASGSGVTLTDNTGGADLLSGVERIVFSDGTGLALDTTGNGAAAEVYRLFGAMFDRAPAESGMGYWMNSMDQGTSIVDIAAYFVVSPEFNRLYGADSSNRDFVTALYHNVLNREPLQGGLDFWFNALENGTTRAQVLVNFSDSAEYVATMSEIIPVGVPYTPVVA